MKPIKPWKGLTFTDDYMFKKVMEARDICRDTLNESLAWNIQHITYFEEEKSLQPFYGSKGIRLDAYIHDDRERIYDIEMQVRKMREKISGGTASADAMKSLAKRARCYLDEIDMERIHFVKQQEQEERDYMIFEMRLRDERAEARDEGRAEGKAVGKAEAARSLMESLDITKEKAMELLKIPAELQPKVLALL